MHSRRNRFGVEDGTKSIRPSPSSFGSWSKTKPRGVRSWARKNNRFSYLIILFVGSILCCYMFAISSIVGNRKSQEALLPKAQQNDQVGAGEQPSQNNDKKVRGSQGEKRSRNKKQPMKFQCKTCTAEGQRKLQDQQKHVPKELSKLLPKLKILKEKHPVAGRKGKRSKNNIFKPYNKKNRVQLDKKFDKKGNLVYAPITSIKKEDLPDMGYDQKKIDALGNITYDEAIKGRERLVDILHDAGIDEIDPEAIAFLPKWSSVKKLYGDRPVVLGLERCEEFRREADPADISVGTAGMFNTGTNPMAMYVSNNCKLPTNKKDKAGGTRWQVPWGKHRLASEKLTNTAGHEAKTNKTNVLPIVMVRDPYSWMQSMCIHKYEGRWPHGPGNCPNLAEPKIRKDGTVKKVKMFVKYNPPIYFDSLADYWGQWYKEYLEADYPRLIVRFEDIQFHARELIETICQCVGAVPRERDHLFRYVVDSAKWGKAHHHKTNMITAMVKYGTDKNRFNGFKDSDWVVAKEVFTPEIMDLFGYEMPEKLRDPNDKGRDEEGDKDDDNDDGEK